MEIKPYNKERDEEKLMHLFEIEGAEWAEEQSPKYRKALQATVTYVAYEEEKLCGFTRSIDDAGLYMYVCDLLVTPAHRGKSIGKNVGTPV